MIERGTLWLPLAILLVLAVLSFWIQRLVQLPAGVPLGAHAAPEGIMEDFRALRTDAQGRPLHRLSAQRFKHYTGSKLTVLEAPRFTQYDSQRGEIDASSQRATVSKDGELIDLTGNVRVTWQTTPGRPATVLTSARLKVFPDERLLRSPGRIEFSDPALHLVAGAMEYRTDLRTIKLTGRVKARYLTKAR